MNKMFVRVNKGLRARPTTLTGILALSACAAAFPALAADQTETATPTEETADVVTDQQRINARRRARGRPSRAARRDNRSPQSTPTKHPPPDTEPFDPNRRSGLKPVPPPPLTDANNDELAPHRWELLDKLGVTRNRWFDPYGRNRYKADNPLHDDWFLSVLVTSDTVLEPRSVPTPVGAQGERGPDQLNVIGGDEQYVFNQNLVAGLVYFKGDTVFRPPDYEYRLTLVGNINYVNVEQARALRVNPGEGSNRRDQHIAVQELFADKHLRNVSKRYDFDSLRVGIQPFTTDFRGFLFQDLQLGIRLFGTRLNNIFQYNLAAFRRIEKDTNSGLNDIGKALRDDDVFVANLYWQDFPKLGYISQATAVYNRNREGDNGSYYNSNGFIERPASLGRERPRNYDVLYLGYNGDGHFGRLNITNSFYFAVGEQDQGVFVDGKTDIRAFFAAAELGWDMDWTRIRFSGVYASGDDDPFDDQSNGFDAIFENPLFAGFDTNYWTRQNVPLIGGGRVAISQRNGMLNNLRSSKEEGQSNFDNPGTILLGVGSDHDITPQFRVSTNINYLRFVDSTILEVARNQGSIDEEIGLDLSIATIWRPFFTQNIVFRGSGAVLLPGQGYKQLFGDEIAYSVLLNLVLNY